MGLNSAIEWTTHTFNPWIGCTRVSAGCAHCYAERNMGRRLGVHWGAGEPRQRTAASTWRQPLRWNRDAAHAEIAHTDETNLGKDLGPHLRPRVFCASLADVFDPEVPIEWLADLFALIAQCPHLDWLLLTKRPEQVLERLEQASYVLDGIRMGPGALQAGIMLSEWRRSPPAHVWIGTSVEHQAAADARLPILLQIPAAVRFLSCEPLLAPVDLTSWLACYVPDTAKRLGGPAWQGPFRGSARAQGIHWIICGGESGPKARPMHPAWAQSLRDQAQAAGVGYVFKQWGEWGPCPSEAWHGLGPAGTPHQLAIGPQGDTAGGFLSQELTQQREREGWVPIQRLGKAVTGRLLDGQTWDDPPTKPTATPPTSA